MDVNKNRPVQFDSLHRTVLLSESEEKCRYKSEGYVYKAVGLEGRFLGIYSVKLERGGIFNLARVTDEEYYPGIVREIIGVGDPVNPGVKGIHTRDRPESRHQLFQLGNNVIRIDAARQNGQLTVSCRICLLNGFIEIITELELRGCLQRKQTSRGKRRFGSPWFRWRNQKPCFPWWRTGRR